MTQLRMTIPKIAESEEQSLIEDNLTTIRHYLKIKFPGYTITEDSVPSLYHQFTVTLSYISEPLNGKLYQSYGLKVRWSRLSDRRNTPERTRLSLNRDLVASWMVRAGRRSDAKERLQDDSSDMNYSW